MANTLRELTDGYALNQLKLVAEQLTNIGKLDKSLSNNFTFTNELLSANKAALQLKHALAESYNQRLGNIDLSQFNKQLNLTGKTLSDYQQELSMIGVTGNKAFNDLARSVATAEKPLIGMGKIANSLWDTLGNTIKWQASSAIVQGVMKNVASATSYVKQLDSSLNNIQIVTNQSSAYMAEFAKNANKAAQELNTTTNEYAKASLIYYQQGLDNKQVQDRVATTIKLANVSGQSAKVVSDQLTAVWNNFYNGSKNLEFYADAMAALGATTASSSSEIAKGLEKFAAIADSTGLSFEYASSALATVVANTRQSADSVGTSFRTLFSRLQGLSLGETLDDGTTLNKYSKALLSVGVNIKEANGDLKNMDTILTELGSKWQSLAQDEKVALAQTVGGARNYTGLMSLMDNWDDFTTNLKTAQTAQGTLQRQADVYAKSWEAASAHVRAASESIYSNLLNDDFIKGMTNLYGSFLGGVGQIMNNLGGAKGTLAGITSLLTQHIFKDKVPGLIASTGETLMGFTSRGSERLEARRQEALNALTTNTNISTYQEVNQAYAKQMQGTLNRQRDFDKAVEQGRIASYEVPIYQQLFQNIDAQKNQAIEQTETAARNKANAAVSDAYLERAMKTGIAQSRFSDEENREYLNGLIQQKGLQEDQVRKRQTELDEVRAQREGAMQAKQDAMDHRRQLQNDSENIRAEVDKARSAMDQARTAYNQAVQDYGQNSHEAQVAAGQLGQATKTYNQVNGQHDAIIDEYMQVDERVQTYDTALREHLEPAVRKKQSEYDAANYKLEEILGNIDYTQANINLRAQDSPFLTGYYTDENGQRHQFNPIGEQIKEARTNANRAVSLEQLAKDLGFGQDMTGDAGDMIRRQAASTIMELVTGADASKLQEMFGTEIGQVISLQGTALTQSVNFSKKKDEDFKQYQERLKQELMDVFTSEEGGDLLSTLAESALDASIQASGESKESIANLKALSNRLIDSKLPGGQQVADLIDGIIGNTEEYQAIRARGGVEQAEESLGQRIGSAFRELSKPEQIAKSIGLISNLGMTVSTAEQAIRIFSDETATAGDKLGSFGTLAASGFTTYRSIIENSKDLFNGTKFKDIISQDKNGKLKFTNPLTGLGMANLAMVGAMAVGTAAFKTVSAWRENNTTQGRLTQISNDYAAQQQTIAEKRSDKEQLDVITDEYNKQISILRDSLEGSSEYFSTQAEANSIAGNLISRYNLEYGKDYNVQNGTMVIGADVYSRIAEQADQEYLEAVNQGAILQQIQSYLSAQSTIDSVTNETIRKEKVPGGYSRERGWYGNAQEVLQSYLDQNSTYLSAVGRQQSATRSIAELAIQDLANKNNIELNDFVKSAFLNQKDLDEQISQIIKDVEHATIDGRWDSFAEWISGKGFTGLDGKAPQSNGEIWDFLYDAGFVSGVKPEDEAALRAAIRGALPEYYLQDQFIGIADSISDEVKQAFSNYRSLTSEELGNRLQQYDFDSKYKEQLANEVEKVQSNLLAALSANLSPEFLAGNNLRDDYLSQLVDNYSLNELEQISNYAIAGGSIFGSEVTQTILENLSNKRNTDILKQLGKVNWDNTFSALSDINKLARNLGGSENIYSDVLESAIDAMGGENGLFQKLYSSSGFQDVLSKLTDQFDTMGSITTDYVVKLASKNEELSSLLDLGQSGYSGLSFNVGGLTKTLNLIQEGTLRPGQITSNLLSALSEGEYSEAVKQNGFAAVDNQDLGRSGTDLLDYFTNAQKAYLNAKSQDLVFDTPLRNVFDTMMPESIRNAYYEANAAAGGGESFQQVMDRADLPQEVKDFLNSTNKKGTKPVTTWAQVNDMYGALIKGAGAAGDITKVNIGGIDISSLPEEYQNLLNEENLSLENYMKYAYGLSFANGNLNLLDTTGNKEYQYTTRETEEHLRKIFEAMGIRNASQLASIHIAQLAESSGGAILRKNDAKAAVEEIIAGREPIVPGGQVNYSEAELNALWDAYGTDTGYSSREKMITDILNKSGGFLTPELDTDFWKNNGSNIEGIANAFMSENQKYGIGILGGKDGFLSLMEKVGAMKDGALDYNKFKEFMLSTGATEADFDNLFTEDNWNDILGDILSTTVTDKFGNSTSIQRRTNESYEDYQKRVEEAQRQGQSDVFSYISADGKTYTIDDPLGIKRQHYHPGENGEPGTWDKDWDPREKAIPTSAFIGQNGDTMGINPVTGEMMIYQDGKWINQSDLKPEPPQGRTIVDENGFSGTEGKFNSELEQPTNPLVDNDYVENKIEEKIDTLTPDDRSLGERWTDFTQGIGNGLKTVAGTVIGAILNPFGVKAEADIEEGKEAPFGNKPEAITDDTYNPSLGMTFSEWKTQKAQQEQQLQQAQLEQESQRQAWQNYQDALSAETDFLTENGDFVTDPENARLAAWTAAARENPDLLGALYQNALKEGYTGDQFTQMYDYQGLHGTTQSALSTAVGGIFNGSNVTAQQRFDFINSAYEKALSQGTTALSPFEKQVLTMIGEIDENTGTLVEHGEEEGDAATRAKKNKQVNEEGELVDEEGNPIEMPQNQQSTGGGTGGRDSGDTGGGGRGGSTSDSSGMDAKTGADMRGTPAMALFNQIIKDGGGAADLLGAGFEPEAVAEYYDSVNKVAEATGNKASGQNNARLLSYASGKEGHIAITGELGPELRVKSDGSMDILGKTGREYAWVEPGDRIYTAQQSAGILKSNKIPGLEGLAKGINNFIPGYAPGDMVGGTNHVSSGGSGGSSGGSGRGGGGGAPTETDPRYDPNTLKIRDVLERYYTILQKIDDITRAVENFAKVADRAWGQDRIKAIEKQTSLYQQQYDAQKQYVKQIGEYMNTDKNALTTMIREFVEGWNTAVDENPDPNNTMEKISWAGAAFDSNGVLTNYRDFVEKLVEQYNNNAQANAMDKNAQYKFQEQLKDIQMYTDTLNLWESETDKLQELANQILDNSLKEITYRVEYELELNADQKRLLDFQDSFVKDDIFRVAEHISNMNEEIANTADSLEKTRKGLYDYLGTLAGENMRTGEFYDDVALGIATRDEQGLVSAKNYDDIDFKQVSNTIDSWINKLSKEDAEEVNKIVQRDANEIITNYRDVVNKINEMNEKLSSDSISLLLNDAQQFFDKISDLTNNPKWTGLSTEMKDQITNYMDQMIQYIQSMGAEFQEIVESMGDSIKAFGKKIDAEIDEFDYYGDVYKSFGNIIDLTNQHMTDITADFFNTLNSKALDNNINKIEAARRRYDLFTKTLGDVQAQYNAMLDRLNNAQGAEEKAFYQQRVDELKEQLDIANSQMESAHKDFLQSWEDALSKIQESYKSAIEQASKDFEKGFSPLFNTLALLQAQFDREKALGDLYVDNYQKIHDLNKLNRDIDQSISDTDNLKSKGRLRDLQKEIRDLQEDGTELSEYDLDILDKKYKLELARQALEDARDVKSIVRLSRDNNGNWGYVYTADEDEIAEAEQNYEDAIRDMEEANQNYIDNIQDQILQVQQEAQQAILALQPEDFATYDDYLAAVQNIQNSMYQTLDYLRSQLNNAFGNNDWLETIVPGIIKDHDLTNDFENTPLAQLLVNGNLDSMIDSAKTNLQENLIEPALESFTIYSEKQKEVYAAAGKDMATIGQTFGKEMDTLTEKSEEQVDVVMKLADRVEDSFGKTMDAVIKATNDWLNKIKDVIKEYDILLEKITELKKIDGEYVEPHKTINDDDAVDAWEELDRFKRELADNGTINLITTDTTTGKERATKYVAGSPEAQAFLDSVKEAAIKKDIIDLGDDDINDNENNEVLAYLNAHKKVWVRFKGEELMFTSVEEWEAWRDKHKPAPAVDTGGGGETPWTVGGFNQHWLDQYWTGGYLDTGGYTGRWQFADTGMYTGEWPMGSVRRNGRLAWLHQKELVLNAHDTENFLDAMQVVRQLDNLTNWMANGLGDLIMPKVTGTDNELEQNVHIEAEFPNVTDHNEIEQAFTNLVNMASQYANRK